MGAITPDTIVHLLAGTTMTARRKAARAKHSAWVGVVSLEPTKKAFLNSVDADSLGRLHVRSFEIPDELLPYGDIGDEAAVDLERFTLVGTKELEILLERLGVDPSSLAFKADTEYPL